MKRYLSLLLILMLVSFTFTACGKDKKEEEQQKENNQTEAVEDLDEEYSDTIYDEEDDEVEINKVEKDVSKFYGSWTAKSGKAEFLYGNVDITVKEDGTWTGNITGEDLGGTWEDKGDHLHMNDELFSFDLAFSSSGSLVMLEEDGDDELATVLTKK